MISCPRRAGDSETGNQDFKDGCRRDPAQQQRPPIGHKEAR